MVTIAEDRVGGPGTFRPGPDPESLDPSDWRWEISVELSEARCISAITVQNQVAGEGWSTSDQHLDSRPPYPLGVFHNQTALVTAYDTPVGCFPAGTHQLALYGQRRSSSLSAGKIAVIFADGSTISASFGGMASEKLPAEATCQNPGIFGPGKVWKVQEGLWHGEWRRRGDSATFDATWTGPQQQVSQDVLTLLPLEGSQVKISRLGTPGYYHGQLSCDRRHVIDGRGDWFMPGERWSAEILEDLPALADCPTRESCPARRIYGE